MQLTVRSGSSAAESRSAARGPWGSVALLAVLLGLLVAVPVAHAAGELDPTFSGDGKLLTDFGDKDTAFSVAVQADGKVIAAGDSFAGPNSIDFALARYNPDGSLDPTFSGDGKVLTDFGGSSSAGDVTIQADGKIVAAGSAGDSFALARYNTDGSLDPTFSGDGKVLTHIGGGGFASGVAIQADQKIVAAGVSFNVSGDFALARYNADGSLDSTFSGDGKLTTDFFGEFDAADGGVAIQADQKIVAAGFSTAGPNSPNFALTRYNPNGSLDPTFDADGRVVTDFGSISDFASGVAIQADQKIVAAGAAGGRFGLARYDTGGGLDPSFDGDGLVTTDFGAGAIAEGGLAIQADGKIVAAGHTGAGANPSNFALARYDTFGGLDPSFDGDGMVVTNFGSPDFAYGVAIQPNGRIVAAGESNTGANPPNFALARYLDGTTEPEISINDVAGLEGNAGLTAFAFTVSLSKPSSETITVSRQTADGSASAPPDYSALAPATLTFSPGQTSKTVTVRVKGDVAIEPNETFFVNLSSPTNAVMTDGQGKGTILNDDLSATSPCTITGTAGDDILTGTPGNDVICAGSGNDQLFGVGGNDILKGENGNDLLVGGSGFDLLVGSTGTDDLRGESGNDTLRGGDNGDDTLNGGTDSDALFGNGGTDSLNTQDGVSANDSADGGSGSDSCVFDPGDFVTSCP
jgi:uncharacterized delta-60 repeat protein